MTTSIPSSRRPAGYALRGWLLALASSLTFTIAASAAVGDSTNPPAGTQPPPRTAPVAASSDSSRIEDEIVTLSPFEVSANGDDGYSAATSLAGNRLNTDLRDVGSAITVVTAQLMSDIGATNNESLLQYTTNTEVGNIYGNMANAGSGTQLDETGKFANPNQNTRVRGLAAADTTVDYFLTDIPWDGYNVDRVDFQRGPNAILFGLGSPAGIINAGTESAMFRNKGQVQVRYSRFDSVRTTLDLNYVLRPRELAFRINGLLNKEKFQQDPAFSDDRRIAGAVRYEPAFLNKGSAHTTLKANFELGDIRSNRPRSLTPGDSITPWFYPGTATGYTANGTAFTYRNLDRRGFDARGLQDGNIATIGQDGRGEFVQTYNGSNTAGGIVSGTPNPYWQPWLGGQFASGYFGQPMVIFNNGDSTASNTVAWEPVSYGGLNSAGAIDRSINGFPNTRMSSMTIYRDISKKVNLPGAKFGLTRNLALSDPSIFDFYNLLIDGPNKNEWQNFKRYNVNLAQTFLDGKFGVEAVYDRQSYDNGQNNLMTDKGQQLFVDVMRIMADGATNPNFGRPFISTNASNSNSYESERDAFRLTAFARHDFAKRNPDSLLLRILGRHTVTGLYSNDTQEVENRSWRHWVADNAWGSLRRGPGANASIDSNERTPYPVVYLGPSLVNATSASGAHIPNPSVAFDVISGSARTFDPTWTATSVSPAAAWENTLYPVGHPSRTSTQSENPANYRGWINAPVTITDAEEGHRDENTTSANMNKRTIESKAANWQAHFWGGALVGMYGYRTDTARSWSVVANRDLEGRAILDRSVFRLPTSYTLVEDNSKSWSVVAHLNQFLKGKLPLDVSLFYNKSENFQPLAGRVGPLNNLLTPPVGDTKDMGILIATKDGKYSLKVNKYETSVTNSNGTSGFNSFYLGQLFTDGNRNRNRFAFEVSDPTNPNTYHDGPATNWTYGPATGQSEAQALAAQQADVAGWDAMINALPAQFITAWKLTPKQTSLSELSTTIYNYQTPTGFTIPEDNISKGLEFELYAQPIRGLRLTLNASKQEAERNNVGDAALNSLVTQINTALNNTPAGSLRLGTGPTSATALSSWNANFWASWLSVKGQEGNAVPELRKWRSNLIANYDFQNGMLKGFSVGAGYRWQAKVINGYKPLYFINSTATDNPWLANVAKFDLNSPYYGPAETNVDLWVGYRRKLTSRVDWHVQLNVRNVGERNSLIPVTVQPDGAVASWRIAPTEVWSLTNTFEF